VISGAKDKAGHAATVNNILGKQCRFDFDVMITPLRKPTLQGRCGISGRDLFLFNITKNLILLRLVLNVHQAVSLATTHSVRTMILC
jgi:hypothetical protein